MTQGQDARSDPAGEDLGPLLDAALAGSQDAFRRLVEARRDLVYRVAYQQLGRPEDARAVAQDVFIRLWRNLHLYDRARRFDTWLYQVTVNAAIDHRRRAARWQAETVLDEGTLAPARTAPLQRDQHDTLTGNEVQRIMNELAEQLPDRQRAAFVLREIEGLSTMEVAEALGATESTVRNHLFQARRILAEALSARYPEYARRVRRTGAKP